MFRCVVQLQLTVVELRIWQRKRVWYLEQLKLKYYLLNILRKSKPRKMDIRTCYKYEDKRTTQWQWSPPAHLSSAIMCPFPITHYTLETTPVVKYAWSKQSHINNNISRFYEYYYLNIMAPRSQWEMQQNTRLGSGEGKHLLKCYRKGYKAARVCLM